MKKIIIVLLGAIVLLNSCMLNGHRVKGNGNVVTENKQVGDFTGVELQASFDVFLSEGSATSIKIEAEENIIPHIELHVVNGILNIETEDNIWLSTRKPVKIFITSPGYNNIQVSSSGTITGQTKISNATKLDISVSGSGELKLDVDAPEIETNVSGSGEMSLSGETKKFSGDVSGSGDIKAMNLKSEESDLQVSGSGNIDVYASIKLEANVSGSGDVRYKGDAQVTKNISGSGEVKKVN
jgi:hypothetical protein